LNIFETELCERQKAEVNKSEVMEQNDLSKRLFIFSVRTIKFLRTLPYETEYKVIRYQLIKRIVDKNIPDELDFSNK